MFEALKVFGEVPEDIVKREKYAKWKSTYINKCLRNGETPIPGPVAGTDAEEFGFFSEGAGNEQENFNTFTPTNNIGFNNPIAPSDEPINYTPNFIPASQLLNQQQQEQQQPYVAPQNSYTPSGPSSTVTSCIFISKIFICFIS